jgi:hypothetical protein
LPSTSRLAPLLFVTVVWSDNVGCFVGVVVVVDSRRVGAAVGSSSVGNVALVHFY